MRFTVSALLLVFMLSAQNAWAGRLLDEKEMDSIAAGAVSAEVMEGMLNFKFSKASGPDFAVDGFGTIALKGANMPGRAGSIIMRDNAQSNLSSIVNITAVDSLVQVLMNLNVNVNSQVGTLKQFNLSGGF